MREEGKSKEGVRPRATTPAPRPLLHDSVEAALSALHLDAADRVELLERIRAMGLPDPMLRERIGMDRLTLTEAARQPLTRTDPSMIPSEGEAPSVFLETFYLPSGRLCQLRRRFPSMDELDHALRQGSYRGPALWIREIELAPGRELAPADLVDAATVISLPSHHD